MANSATVLLAHLIQEIEIIERDTVGAPDPHCARRDNAGFEFCKGLRCRGGGLDFFEDFRRRFAGAFAQVALKLLLKPANLPRSTLELVENRPSRQTALKRH